MKFSCKFNNLHFVQKLLFQKTPTHFIWNENAEIFPENDKKIKIFQIHSKQMFIGILYQFYFDVKRVK